jgi:hypothetical protein
MRATACLKALLILALSSIAWIGPFPAASGIGRTQAAEFYTRKRVNGKWITGRFPKRSAASSTVTAPSRKRVAAPAVTTAAASAVPAIRAGDDARAPGEPRPAVTAPLAEDERLLALQKALQARASTLAVSSPPLSAGSGQATTSPDATGSLVAAEAPPPATEPRSVSFDFHSGMKTTVFSNGASTAEPFDPSSIRPLASPAPR